MRKAKVIFAAALLLYSGAAQAEDAAPQAPLAWAGLTVPPQATTPPTGTLEANYIMASLVGAMSANIRTTIARHVGTHTNIIPVVGTGSVGDIGAFDRVDRQVITWSNRLRFLESQTCAVDALTWRESLNLSPQALVQTALAAWRSTRTITEIAVTTNDALILNSLMHDRVSAGISWLLPSMRLLPPDAEGGVHARYTAAYGRAIRFAGTACGKSAEYKSEITAIIQDMSALVSTPEPGETSPLEQAIMLEGLNLQHSLVLSVDVAHAGGTSIKTENLWTLLGARDLHYSGGIIASYRLVDPVTAQILVSGTVRCMAPVQSFESVHRLGRSAFDPARYCR